MGGRGATGVRDPEASGSNREPPTNFEFRRAAGVAVLEPKLVANGRCF